MTMTDELLKLQQLRESGALTEDEFQRAKEKLLTEDAYGSGAFPRTPRPKEIERETRQWAFFIHPSSLSLAH